MDMVKVVATLREEHSMLVQAIAALERLLVGRKRKGRPPKASSKSTTGKRRGRPPGSKKKSHDSDHASD